MRSSIRIVDGSSEKTKVARRERAFALVELAVTTVMFAVLMCLLLVCAPASRRMAWQGGSLANLHEFATVTASYQADNNDLFWTLSWRPGVATPGRYPDLRGPWSDILSSGAAQAIDILRWRTGWFFDVGLIGSWIPHVLYSHLVLSDYLDQPLPLRFAVSPGDKYRRLWANDPNGFRANVYLPNQPDGGDPNNWRWPFSSSYRYPVSFAWPDAASTRSCTLIQSGVWTQYWLSPGPQPASIGRNLGEVNFPSQKVILSDTAQWQGVRRPVFCLMAHARVPVLLVDGSAKVTTTGQSNRGFQPGSPRSIFPTTTYYSAQPWDAPNTVPGTDELITGYHYWTRGGIMGRDFDGQEIDTSTW